MGCILMYNDELKRAMELLAKNKRVLFLGQQIACPGSNTYTILKDIPISKKIELPIIEDMQMGISLGLALEGFIPVTMFARMDFIIIALNQLVNHLDKLEGMSCGRFKPKVIIRTIVGSTGPLNPGPQHSADYTEALKCMLKNVEVIKIMKVEDIVPSYEHALKSKKSTLLVEVPDLY